MKKILTALLLLWTVVGIADAQVCKISDSGDNVEVFSAFIKDGNTVEVTVSNDSKDISANVSVKVKVTYEVDRNTENFTGKALAEPNKSTAITIPIPVTKQNRKATKVEVIGITGTKCK